ncbi:MAG: endolytic transglycosylase MltG [Gammaproteobacteria bacterium]|nr:endolytic transglycosylase MltG [Gammaproteobacteria bacterium]MCY4218405.1 endolytic transglycosylase MltG [Gammaproteobacteria bacterium]MCY4273895.1 endolytic transglycosylase MltG [Gammaproteobacteria bacterium]
MLKKATLGVLAVALAIGVAVWLDYDATTADAIQFQEGDVLFVARGDTLSTIIRRFEEEKRIDKSWPYLLYARYHELGDSIHFGEYSIEESVHIEEFIRILSSGDHQIQYRVTIVEGWTFRQMRDVLDQTNPLRNITSDWEDDRIMAEIGQPNLHPEGQFYPDTYFYHKGETDLDIYKIAFREMQEQLDHAWENRSEDLQLQNQYEISIMASIIEKESLLKVEEPQISSVFNNRLIKGMRLQADPTVIYGLGDQFKGNLTRKHLRTDTPYNTYTRSGLPPTPISLPGKSALMAAARPLQTTAYYFVARGDGSHKFSDTLAEHNAAVRKYQLRR